MCKKNSEENKEKQKPPKFSMTTRVFLFVSIIFSLTMAFLVIWPITHTAQNVCDVQVSLKIPNDSTAVEYILHENESQIQSLVKLLDEQSQEITDKYNLLIKSQEIQSDFFRLVSCIAAFVVALLGFLGYKTVRDIEAKAQSGAKEQASETARRYVSVYLKNEVGTQLEDRVKDTTIAKLVEEQLINRIMPKLKPLEDRIGLLESKNQSQPESTLQVEDEAIDAFSCNDEKIAELTKQAGENSHE